MQKEEMIKMIREEEVQKMYQHRIHQFINAVRASDDFTPEIIAIEKNIKDIRKILGKSEKEIDEEVERDLMIAQIYDRKFDD